MEELEHTIASAVLFTIAVIVGVILGGSDDLPAAAPAAPATPTAASK